MSDKIIGYPYRRVITSQGEKAIPYNWDLVSKQEYEQISQKIWGCIPHDVNWAINTKPFKDELSKRPSIPSNLINH